jgi:hypothetical protein
VPVRTTLGRRFKALADTVEQLLLLTACWADRSLGEAFQARDAYADASLVAAEGHLWHQRDKQQGIMPSCGNIDPDAEWGFSPYHGWTYGYGMHAAANASAFPLYTLTVPANVSDLSVVKQQRSTITDELNIRHLTADDRYTDVWLARDLLLEGTVLITPALRLHLNSRGVCRCRWKQAYVSLMHSDAVATFFRHRKTTIEPLFDLIKQVLGVGQDSASGTYTSKDS